VHALSRRAFNGLFLSEFAGERGRAAAAAAGLPERDGLRCIALEREAQCVLWQRALQLFYSCTATVGLAMLNSLMATGVKGSSVSGIFL